MIGDHSKVRRDAEAAGQGHLFHRDAELTKETRARLTEELARLDWDLLGRLAADISASPGGASAVLEPAPSIVRGADPAADEEARVRGERLLADGRVAVFVVAGGQGSRLGFDGPKGLYPATPCQRKSLFRLFAEKVRARAGRAGRPLPWYVMTSRGNHDATVAYFEESDYFGLDRADVTFFSQAMLPAMDTDGRLLLERPGELFLSPNGHGGSLLALRESGALEDMVRRGVEQIFYFQVDNPLAVIADPVFMGYHDAAGAQMSTKVVPKRDAHEKVGVLGLVDGRYGVIEYSDLTSEEREVRDGDGRLRFNDGNIAIHALRRDFVEAVTVDGLDLPFHLARKGIECVDPVTGEPRRIEGVKFETFVFDALARCDRSVVLSVDRAEEFAPIKNAAGEDSPATSSEAQTEQFARWLEAAGVAVPRDADGRSVHRIEIAPAFADSASALAARDLGDVHVDGDLYLA